MANSNKETRTELRKKLARHSAKKVGFHEGLRNARNVGFGIMKPEHVRGSGVSKERGEKHSKK